MTAAAANPPPAAPGILALIRVHARTQILEQLRIPVAVISSALFPSLSFTFFVLPQQSTTNDPVQALAAVGQLAMFGVMNSFLFNYGIGVAEERANPWSSYVRTLPAGPVPPTLARALTATVFAFIALVPLLALAFLLTQAGSAFTDGTLPWWRIPAALVVWLLCGLPFLAMGLVIGYLCTSRVATAVTQVAFFPLAFAGGMLLPPFLFPGWLNTFSLFLPSRAARDIGVHIITGTGMPDTSVLCIVAWTVGLGGLALWANRRDQGRSFR